MSHSLCAQKTEEELDKSECPWLVASKVHQDKGEKILRWLCTWSLMSHHWSKGCIWLGQLSEHSATWFWDGILESCPCVATASVTSFNSSKSPMAGSSWQSPGGPADRIHPTNVPRALLVRLLSCFQSTSSSSSRKNWRKTENILQLKRGAKNHRPDQWAGCSFAKFQRSLLKKLFLSL